MAADVTRLGWPDMIQPEPPHVPYHASLIRAECERARQLLGVGQTEREPGLLAVGGGAVHGT